MRNIILFGAPGAGKSTMVELLEEKRIPFSLVSMGQILRDKAKEDSPTGRKIKETMAKGDLMDDHYITALVKEVIRKIDKNKPIILDGYPRTLIQLEAIDSIFEENKLRLPVLVYIKITMEEAIRRLSARRVCSKCKENFQVSELGGSEKCLKCGGKIIQREDDKPEAIKNRFEIFEMQFELIKYYFEKRNRYFEIDGALPKEERVEHLIKIIQS